MNHAELPAVATASLPQTYENAKSALAECSQLDECKDWTDKAMAMASYARQAKDDSLRKMADRIKARAIRRAGELLKQIEPAQGQNHGENGRLPAPSLSRTQAAADAGMSDHQRKTALRVANIDDDEFQGLVDSEEPPTIGKLAEIGTQKNAVDLGDRSPKDFNKCLHFVAGYEHFLKELRQYDVASVAKLLNEAEREKLRGIVAELDAINDSLITRI